MEKFFNLKKQEELQWYKGNIDIREYLQSTGYVLDKSRNTKRYQAYFHEGRGDKIYVPMDTRYPVPSYYVNQYDQKDKGTLVDFIMSREKKSLDEARLVLRAFNSGGPYAEESYRVSQNPGPKAAKEKLIAELAEQQRRHQVVMDRIMGEKTLKDESYLRSRFLEEETIRSRAFKGKVLLDKAPDGTYWVFPLREIGGNQVVGMALKNEQGDRMLGRRTGLWISGPTKNSRAPIEQAVLVEHPIDGMSYYQLNKKEILQVNTVFISTAGNPSQDQKKAVREFVAHHQLQKVVLAHDNDKAGAHYNKMYQELLGELNVVRKESPLEIRVATPLFKDFNADIKARKVLELRQLEQQDITNPKHLLHFHPLKQEIAKMVEGKNYQQLARKEVVKELQESFVVKEMDGMKVHFSIRELALINNQQKLLQIMERAAKESHREHTPSPKKEMEQKLVSQKEVRPEKEERQNLAAMPGLDRPPLKRTMDLERGDQQLEKTYFKTIKNLQLQIKGVSEYREQYQRLDLYKKYPHLNEEEVDTYLGLMLGKSRGIQQQQSLTKGKGIVGPEMDV